MSLLDERGERYMRARANCGAASAPKTEAQRRTRRDLYWFGLYENGGLSYRDIAAHSGFSVYAVFYGVQAGRKEASRLKAKARARAEGN